MSKINCSNDSTNVCYDYLTRGRQVCVDFVTGRGRGSTPTRVMEQNTLQPFPLGGVWNIVITKVSTPTTSPSLCDTHHAHSACKLKHFVRVSLVVNYHITLTIYYEAAHLSYLQPYVSLIILIIIIFSKIILKRSRSPPFVNKFFVSRPKIIYLSRSLRVKLLFCYI